MFQKTIFIMLLLAVVSCQKKESVEKDKIKAAEWIIGNWENKSPEGILNENWKKVNDSTFSATSYFIKEKDTLHFETIVLAQKGETLTYIATVKGQNDGKPVTFSSTSETENKFTFENSKHDYPRKITYLKGADNNFTVEISGKLQGKVTTERFVMVKK
jgi:hypothetical protein